MDWNSYLQSEGSTEQYGDGTVPSTAYGNPISPLPQNVVEPSIGKYIGFMALIYFIGEFCWLPYGFSTLHATAMCKMPNSLNSSLKSSKGGCMHFDK